MKGENLIDLNIHLIRYFYIIYFNNKNRDNNM